MVTEGLPDVMQTLTHREAIVPRLAISASGSNELPLTRKPWGRNRGSRSVDLDQYLVSQR